MGWAGDAVRVIAIDPGSRSGFAWTDTGEVIGEQSGVWDCRPRSKQRPGHRYLMFRAHLNALLHGHDDAVVFYEQVNRHAGTRAAHVYGGFESEIEGVCAAREIDVYPLPVKTIKKRATGNGNADKVMMIAAAELKFGIRCDDDNRADALHILDAGLAQLAMR